MLSRAVCHAMPLHKASIILLTGTGQAVHSGVGIGQTICMMKHTASDFGAHSDTAKVNRRKACMLLLACLVYLCGLPQPVG